GKDGQDGTDGKDGKDANPVTVVDNGDGTYDIVTTDSETGKEIGRVTVKNGEDGTDGKDGQTPKVAPLKDADGNVIGITVTPINPDGTEGETV
ncbi:hypothetical protein, partial [Pseudomonas fluorescens]|uniref:hypothetical protein n=1 Tax=Pseudomonas fluorescens TaxID=294 RepID=UPI002B1D5C0F